MIEGIVRLMSLNSNSDLKLAYNCNVRKKLSVYILFIIYLAIYVNSEGLIVRLPSFRHLLERCFLLGVLF